MHRPQLEAVVTHVDGFGYRTVAVLTADRTSHGELTLPEAEAKWLVAVLAMGRAVTPERLAVPE